MSFMFFGTWWLDPPYVATGPNTGLGGGMVLDQWNTSKVTDMSYMLANTGWGLSKGAANWNTQKVTNMEGLFFGNIGLGYRNASVQLDWDTQKVTNMSKMFSGGTSKSLQSGQYIRSVRSGENNPYAEKNGWTGSATKKGFMMPAANFLRDITFGPKWKTDNVLEMNSMFAFATKLNANGDVDMSGWKVTKVTSGYEMFLGSVIGDVSAPDVSHYTDDSTKKLDLSSWSFTEGADVRGFINPYSGAVLQTAPNSLQFGTASGGQGGSLFTGDAKWDDWTTLQNLAGYSPLRLQWDNYGAAPAASATASTFSPGIGKRCPKIGTEAYSLCGICRLKESSNPTYAMSKTAPAGHGATYQGLDITFSKPSDDSPAYLPGLFTGDYGYLQDAWLTYWDNNDTGLPNYFKGNGHNNTALNLRAGVDKGGHSLCGNRLGAQPTGDAILKQ
jgi:hypothetical protein